MAISQLLSHFSYTYAGLVTGVLIIAYLKYRARWAPAGLRRVPGPRGLPLVGNTLQLGPQPQKQLMTWASEYGEVMQVQIGWENWVFLNTPQAVKEILDKQSAITSGRAPMPVGNDLISGGYRFLLMTYTPTWRKLRTIVHKLLTPSVSNTFMPSQLFEAKNLVFDLMTDNANEEDFYMHVRRYTTSVVLTSTYGRRVQKWQSEDVKEIYGLMKEFSDSTAPGAFIADMIPPLAKLPTFLQWWRERALRYQYRQTKIWMKYWSNLMLQIDQKQAPECFVKQFSETDYKAQGISEVQAAFVAGTMIEAGSETTSSSLNSAILYLAANPAVQARAHAELDEVVGLSASPTFEHENRLPYIRAMVKEILRIRPVTNIGTPHYATADVTYKDFFIPKGTVISIHQYAIHYDTSRYDNPESFRPERYLNHPLKAGAYSGQSDPYARDHFDFGAGRRICPGMHLAENSLFITLAKILWAFHIKPPLQADGKLQTMDTSDDAYELGANTLPKGFKVRFVPRDTTREQVTREEWLDAQKDGFFLGHVKVDVDGVASA
ncbi:Cytochrome P450 monooxygenase [Lachnellula willkommii]|uniref:Cytochrome P450 monooxygenase n=1 Tax=Lachnellula willkommii TaxID=215461 RepID=A0A559MIP7_9HELO|nr:Cytochrome P450 monooxygenase [Lachnellula willkommii]